MVGVATVPVTVVSLPALRAASVRPPARQVHGGYLGSGPILDLSYDEDAAADVDCNVVMTGAGRLVEVQGTAEGEPFSRGDLDALLDLAEAGIKQLTQIQRDVLA